MIYIVHFADGKTAQIHASSELQARRVATMQFRGRLIVSIAPAGLLDIGFRRPPVSSQK